MLILVLTDEAYKLFTTKNKMKQRDTNSYNDKKLDQKI